MRVRPRNDPGTRAGETPVAAAGQQDPTSGEDVVFEIEETVAIQVPIGRLGRS